MQANFSSSDGVSNYDFFSSSLNKRFKGGNNDSLTYTHYEPTEYTRPWTLEDFLMAYLEYLSRRNGHLVPELQWGGKVSNAALPLDSDIMATTRFCFRK